MKKNRLFKKSELRVLWPFYLEPFVVGFLSIFPAFMVLYFRELGFSFFQLSLLLAAIPFFSLIFEIPTGAIADLYGRKFSVVLGVFLQAVGFLLLFFFTNYYSLILIMAFLGIASTLVSGAEEAWITDLINKKNKNLLKYYFALV